MGCYGVLHRGENIRSHNLHAIYGEKKLVSVSFSFGKFSGSLSSRRDNTLSPLSPHYVPPLRSSSRRVLLLVLLGKSRHSRFEYYLRVHAYRHVEEERLRNDRGFFLCPVAVSLAVLLLHVDCIGFAFFISLSTCLLLHKLYVRRVVARFQCALLGLLLLQ